MKRSTDPRADLIRRLMMLKWLSVVRGHVEKKHDGCGQRRFVFIWDVSACEVLSSVCFAATVSI